jgi:hypothetical protein
MGLGHHRHRRSCFFCCCSDRVEREADDEPSSGGRWDGAGWDGPAGVGGGDHANDPFALLEQEAEGLPLHSDTDLLGRHEPLFKDPTSTEAT